jgi:cytochrome P450
MTSASIDDFKLLSPAVLTEPHDFWRRLRDEAPVHEVDEGIGYTILTRYKDVSAALRDPETFSSQLSRRFPAGMSAYEDSPAVKEVLKDACPYHDVLTFVDGETHARHRRIARRPFTLKHVAELDEIIAGTVADLIAGLPRSTEFDLVSEFSIRLPIIVIGHILGVDPQHFDDVKRWADAQVARLGEPLDDDAENLRYATDLVDQHQFLFRQVRARREHPTDDFLSDLVNSGEFSTDEELVLISAQLIVAGAETTASLITTMLNLLLDNPALMERVRRDPSLIPDLVEETLRWDSPIKLVHRIATRDVQVGEHTIKEGSVVLLMIGSANRDDDFAADAEEFDLDRTDGGKHLAFIQGVHMCVGANLARAEARMALEGLFAATTEIQRGQAAVHRRSSLTVRALENLPLVIA